MELVSKDHDHTIFEHERWRGGALYVKNRKWRAFVRPLDGSWDGWWTAIRIKRETAEKLAERKLLAMSDDARKTAKAIIAQLKAGQVLVKTNRMSGPVYTLHPSGQNVMVPAAEMVIENPDVVMGNDGLLPETPQTWWLNK
jgi:hypothetical protein